MARNLAALVVDPDLDSRLDVTHALQSIGFDISGEATFGTEATFLASERHPQVILLAVEDPPMRALATLEALQQQAPDTPIVAYSSVMTPALMRQAMRAGARDFIAKPLKSAELAETINTLLEHEEQRQLARWNERPDESARGTVITVAGAKGGIGKTTLSTNLAIALRQVTGQDVAIVDGDAQFGDIAVMLDLDVRRSIADVARNEADITRATIKPYLARHDSGIDVLAATSEENDWRAMQPEHITAIARSLAETHEYVVLDTPGVMNELVAASLNEAAIVLLVTSLDVSSIKDTKTALRILESWAMPRERVRLVVNDNMRGGMVTADDVAQATGVKVTMVIPYDPNIGHSVQTGVPIVTSSSRSKYAQAVLQIAASIAGVGSLEQADRRAPFIPMRLQQLWRRA